MHHDYDDFTICDQCVVHPWVDDLTLKQQTVLLSAVRGCDGVSKNDISKKFVRVYRATILQNAAPQSNGRFMRESITTQDIKIFTKAPDVYPLHWLFHFLHAVEIVGYNYPVLETRKWWRELYLIIVKALHLNPETEKQNNDRLKDGFSGNCWKT